MKLVDIAKVIRSKNAGPMTITLDLLFNDEAGYKAACASDALTPHFIGADMGSIDPGPYYLGAGKMAQSDTMVRVDLAKCIAGAQKLGIPLLIGTAGAAGARPHLDATLDIVRDIARREGLRFRLASISADMPRDFVKIEGAIRVGERAVLLCGSTDPRVIENASSITAGVEKLVRELTPPRPDKPYSMTWRVYGLGAVMSRESVPDPLPPEIFILCECIADTEEEARAVATVTKQYLLHHGFPGRLSTAGNVAFPFTPPELAAATAYRFNAYHVMEVDALAPLFPVHMEEL